MIDLIKIDLKSASSIIQKIFSDLSSQGKIARHKHFPALKNEFEKLLGTIHYRPEEEALIAVNKLLNDHPCAALYVLVALLREVRGDNPEQVKKLYDAAIDVNGYAIAYAFRGALNLWCGHTDEAREDLEKAIEIDPNLVLAHNYLGELYAQSGETDRAIEEYEWAIKIDPEFTPAHLNLAILYEERGEKGRAMEEYEEVFRSNPYCSDGYNNRGLLNVRFGKKDRAMKDYDKALEIEPEFAMALNNRALLKVSLGKKKEAIVDHNKAIDIDPELAALVHFTRGIALYALRENMLGNLTFQVINELMCSLENIMKGCELRPFYIVKRILRKKSVLEKLREVHAGRFGFPFRENFSSFITTLDLLPESFDPKSITAEEKAIVLQAQACALTLPGTIPGRMLGKLRKKAFCDVRLVCSTTSDSDSSEQDTQNSAPKVNTYRSSPNFAVNSHSPTPSLLNNR